MEREPKEEQAEKELNFEDGLEKVLNKIEQLLATKDCIVIAIGGPKGNDTNVGKTFFRSQLQLKLAEKKIASHKVSDVHSLDDVFLNNLEIQKKLHRTQKSVVIVEGAPIMPTNVEERIRAIREQVDLRLINQPASKKLGLQGVDLYVLIYRPDRKYAGGQEIFADIVIKNERAFDKDLLV